MVDGKRTYDILFELLDPKLVKFQFQVSTISQGYDAAEYFTKYPGRFISMHVQGWSAETEEDRAGGTGLARLEEDLHRRENRRHQELLRRDEPGPDEGQRSVPSQSAGLTVLGSANLLGYFCGACRLARVSNPKDTPRNPWDGRRRTARALPVRIG